MRWARRWLPFKGFTPWFYRILAGQDIINLEEYEIQLPINMNPIEEVIGSTDIYLVDQIMKGRYKTNDTILDAGCGYGRNLHWVLRDNIVIYGVDQDAHAIHYLQRRHSMFARQFRQSPVKKTPF